MTKAFGERQGKDESPSAWLERLWKNIQQYSGVSPDTPAGQQLLKANFVTHSWGDIRKKLEKIEHGNDKELNELLREAQKVYVRRDEEKQKQKTKLMVTTVTEVMRQNPKPHRTPRTLQPNVWQKGTGTQKEMGT